MDVQEIYVINSSLVNRSGALDRFVQLGILGLSLTVILLHVVVGISMMNVIFLFVLYGVLLLCVVYLKYKYINI
jgi:hypothetical protein